MWLCLNNSFLSIVAAQAVDLKRAKIEGPAKDWLSVRARRKGHIERVFPAAKGRVMTWPGRDYSCRAFVRREEVEQAMLREVARINYTNFKSSVRNAELHDAYMAVWSTMYGYQSGRYKPRRLSKKEQAAFGWDKPIAGTRPWFDDMGDGDFPEPRGEPYYGSFEDLHECPDKDPACTLDTPCLGCLERAIAGEPERYGPYDEEADADAVSHLRHPPR